MRYIVESVTLDKDHLMNPGKIVYKIFDTIKHEFGLSYYMNIDRALEIAKEKNNAIFK
ncbi:hypothetical protein LCGC14_2711240 [marine sediment metagenome]|uniref:Uncharacterized protein n=1 Tax=marine sediment metagenome TaxID=412755 RepID=A0A0F8ZCT7_9ZZZZ